MTVLSPPAALVATHLSTMVATHLWTMGTRHGWTLLRSPRRKAAELTSSLLETDIISRPLSRLWRDSFEVAEFSEKYIYFRCHTLERIHSMYGMRSRLILRSLMKSGGKEKNHLCVPPAHSGTKRVWDSPIRIFIFLCDLCASVVNIKQFLVLSWRKSF
jgi:hypothetical protein